jgi:hypothetical protein
VGKVGPRRGTSLQSNGFIGRRKRERPLSLPNYWRTIVRHAGVKTDAPQILAGFGSRVLGKCKQQILADGTKCVGTYYLFTSVVCQHSEVLYLIAQYASTSHNRGCGREDDRGDISRLNPVRPSCS